MSKLKRLYAEFGQSMWYDNIARNLLESGAVAQLVEDGVRGLTSNPSIFHKAITSGTAYDGQLRSLAQEGRDPMAIYEMLAFEDIRRSSRHKSGVAVRFPRMARWRTDKAVQDADSLETIKALIDAT